MIQVNERITIPDEELRFDFVRSGGPGGQNVNKVATKAVLRWNPRDSAALPEPVRRRLLQRLEGRLNREGDWIVTSQVSRDRTRNAADCLEKVRRVVLEAAKPPKPRVPTKPTKASKRRRLEAKRRRSAAKRLRRPPDIE